MSAARALVALVAVSAFSSVPSAFYHRIAEDTGVPYSTQVLFAAHGIASIGGLTLAARPSIVALVSRRDTLSLIAIATALDAAAGLLLVVGGTREFGALLAGRILTGFVLGVVTPIASIVILDLTARPAFVTAAIFGGVGTGALAAGALAQAGSDERAIVAGGCLVLALAAALAAPRSGHHLSVPREVRDRVRVDRALLEAVLLAFAGNGVLGLLSSSVPGVVASVGSGSSLAAGATAGLALLAAGGIRLATPRFTSRALDALMISAATAGASAIAAGAILLVVPFLLVGCTLLGAAAGLAYDRGLNLGRGNADSRFAALAHVQRGGQAGLVLPALLLPIGATR